MRVIVLLSLILVFSGADTAWARGGGSRARAFHFGVPLRFVAPAPATPMIPPLIASPGIAGSVVRRPLRSPGVRLIEFNRRTVNPTFVEMTPNAVPVSRGGLLIIEFAGVPRE
jgi:hypothetical protein